MTRKRPGLGATKRITGIVGGALAQQCGRHHVWAPNRRCCCIDSRPVVDDVAVLDKPAPFDLAKRVEIPPADAIIGGTPLIDERLMSHVVGFNEDVATFEFE